MKSFRVFFTEQKTFSHKDAKRIGDSLGVDWNKVDAYEFTMGLGVESEHNNGDSLDVVKSTKDLAKIVLAHLRELPNYYTKLKKIEEDAPANSVGGGGIAGVSYPIVFKKRKKTKNN